MRIQHNILAMNAYRNYNTNTKALAANLEKLSSGYKINRAGDDAAGLAISEKMRAQIKGLEAASKNVKDGTSLVKTAEGAMQEIQDMLGRMKYLATQSANGTYDNDVDRKALQAEVNQLREEINRIADSANFNGIKLLNGKMGLNEDAFNITTSAAADEAAVAGLFGDPPTAGSTKVTNTILHSESTEGRAGSFTIDLSQIMKKADGVTAAKVEVNIAGITATITATDKDTDLDGKFIASELLKTGGVLENGILVDKDGTIKACPANTAAANAGGIIYEATNNGDGTITFEAKKYVAKDGTATAIADEKTDMANVSDAAAAHKLNVSVSVTNNAAGNGDLTGTENVATTNITSSVKTQNGKLANLVVDFDVTKLTDGMEITLGDSTITVAVGDKSAGKGTADLDLSDFEADELAANKAEIMDRLTVALSGNGYFTVGQTADNKLSLSEIADGSGVSTLDDAHQAKLTSVDGIKSLMSAKKPAANAATKIDITSDKINDGDMLTIGDKKYVFLKDPTKAAAGTTGINMANATTDLVAKLNADGFTAAANGDTVTITSAAGEAATKVLGKGLQLQIGDTSDSYNQMGVLVNDMHTAALGIDTLSIADPESASAAIQTVMDAINSVSSTRGTLGAIQNRLDHTANNLSVMTENIQDAESTIRDTDVAEEMMAYTKNNILVQSAQAMLAQANAVPQGVLQLLG